MSILAPLDPYMAVIKAVLAAVILSAVFFGGCRSQAARDASKLEAKAHELMVCQMDRAALFDALHQVNAAAEQAKRDAKVQADKAADAVKQAGKDRADYDKRVALLGKKLADAMKDDACRVKLEDDLCVTLE